jgi:hypothetical protein
VTEQQHRRWTFLEDNRALTMPGWLPPAEDCPALADLREAHLRVLAAAAEASRAAADLQRQQEEQLEAVRASQEEALFSGKPGKVPEVSVSDAEVIEARERAQAARDALQRFVKQAVSQVRELRPEIMAQVDASWQVAATKRAEAQALLAEAARLEQTPKRIELWLARIDGTSVLGHYAYDQLEAPPEVEPFDMELALAGNANITEVEVNA